MLIRVCSHNLPLYNISNLLIIHEENTKEDHNQDVFWYRGIINVDKLRQLSSRFFLYLLIGLRSYIVKHLLA